MKHIHSAQCGFVSIVAIFILVIMAALGSFMLTFANTQQLTSAQDIKGSQAYWAARAGLEWGMGNIIRQADRTASCTDFPNNEKLSGFDGGFTVAVTCKKLVYTEGPKEIKMFSLTSIANNDPATPGNVGFVERSISVSIEK